MEKNVYREAFPEVERMLADSDAAVADGSDTIESKEGSERLEREDGINLEAQGQPESLTSGIKVSVTCDLRISVHDVLRHGCVKGVDLGSHLSVDAMPGKDQQQNQQQ